MESPEWWPQRPDVAEGVFGRTLLSGVSGVSGAAKVTLTRVVPGGAFRSHVDSWGHVFVFLEGEGRVRVENRTFDARPGVVVTIGPGETHSYENTGSGDLNLISINLPIEPTR